MSWESTRGTVQVAARGTAYADDAKDRLDEATRLRPRSRWSGPALVTVAVLLLGGGTAAGLAMAGAGPDDPRRQPGPLPAASTGAAPDSPPTEDAAEDAAEAAAVDPTTGLPLRPTTETATYEAFVQCVRGGDFLLSPCPSQYGAALECPDGRCRMYLDTGPQFSAAARLGFPTLTFTAGQPGLAWNGVVDPDDECPDRARLTGTRQADGTYELRYVVQLRAGELDGSCSRPSAVEHTVQLLPPRG